MISYLSEADVSEVRVYNLLPVASAGETFWKSFWNDWVRHSCCFDLHRIRLLWIAQKETVETPRMPFYFKRAHTGGQWWQLAQGAACAYWAALGISILPSNPEVLKWGGWGCLALYGLSQARIVDLCVWLTVHPFPQRGKQTLLFYFPPRNKSGNKTYWFPVNSLDMHACIYCEVTAG